MTQKELEITVKELMIVTDEHTKSLIDILITLKKTLIKLYELEHVIKKGTSDTDQPH